MPGKRRSVQTDSIEAWVEALPDSFMLCRDMGHTWRPFRAFWDETLKGYIRIIRCGRCKTERRQLISSTGEVLRGYYQYNEGYQVPKGVGRFGVEGRAYLRLESTLRIIGKDEQ